MAKLQTWSAAVALAAAAVLSVASARIVSFSNKDPITQHTHLHQDTLFSANGNHSKSPFISFKLSCKETPDARVSWIIVHTNALGITLHELEDGTITTVAPKDGSQEETKRIVTALCPSLLQQHGYSMDDLKCDDDHLAHSNTATTLRPGRNVPRLRRDKNGKKAKSPTSAVDETTVAVTTIKPGSVTNPADVVEKTRDGEYRCSIKSGLTYWHVKRVASGCKACGRHFETEHKERAFITEDGFYTLWLESWFPGLPEKPGPRIVGESTFMNKNGYLSATLYPLMVFFGAMGFMYLAIGIVWIVLLSCHYYDLLRLQFWIGGVIFLGMLEMSVSFGDLDYINREGTRSQFLMVFSKLLLAGKNTLARLLVLVVSMGYGVVKPRLGNAWKQIAAMGCSYFFFAAAYAVTHAVGQTDTDESKTEMMVIIPLSVLDAAIIWWIFLSLSHTTKILTLRRNEIKLQMYVQFKWVLVFCVSATVVFAIWTLYDKFSPEEVGDWENAWWQDSFWHLLFFVILLAIMYLWRPTTNNSRYAYAPLETDLDDDEDFQVVPNFSSDAMKLRKLANGTAAAASANDVVQVQPCPDVALMLTSNADTFPLWLVPFAGGRPSVGRGQHPIGGATFHR
eukprot:m.77283 g.77283  ORF g.77283 m.77283 type:complete len:623 (-) comp14540_c0_seq4:239-2107(-)